MNDRCNIQDATANILERRWFSSNTAIRAMQAECDTLREVMELAEAEWRRAQVRLARLKSLHEALDNQLIELDETQSVSQLTLTQHAAMLVR